MWGLIAAWAGIIISKVFSGENDMFSSAAWREEKKNELNIDTVLKFVRKEGFIPESVDRNTLRFKCQGDIYLIGVSENNFIQVVKGFNLDAQDNRTAMREAAMIVMAEIRCCKVIVTAERCPLQSRHMLGNWLILLHISMPIWKFSMPLFVYLPNASMEYMRMKTDTSGKHSVLEYVERMLFFSPTSYIPAAISYIGGGIS